MKFYVKPKVSIVLQTEYQFFFGAPIKLTKASTTGSLIYNLGIGCHH
jgi:hypothetical protein